MRSGIQLFLLKYWQTLKTSATYGDLVFYAEGPRP